jgi:hypothetical protein
MVGCQTIIVVAVFRPSSRIGLRLGHKFGEAKEGGMDTALRFYLPAMTTFRVGFPSCRDLRSAAGSIDDAAFRCTRGIVIAAGEFPYRSLFGSLGSPRFGRRNVHDRLTVSVGADKDARAT